MRILVFEDTAENVAAAQQMAQAHPEHEFVFTADPTEALRLIKAGEIDGLISDFFTPRQHDAESLWEEYIRPTAFYAQVSRGPGYYPKDLPRELVACVKRLCEVDDKPAFNYWFKSARYDNVGDWLNAELANPYLDAYRGYGGGLMIHAAKRGIPCVLISDVHRHGTTTTGGNPVNGWAIFTSLVAYGLTDYHEIDHGRGRHLLCGNMGRSKTDPRRWEEALELLLDQTH